MTFNTMHYKGHDEDCSSDGVSGAMRMKPVPATKLRLFAIDSHYAPEFFTTGHGSNDGHVRGTMRRTYGADGRLKKVVWKADDD